MTETPRVKHYGNGFLHMEPLSEDRALEVLARDAEKTLRQAKAPSATKPSFTFNVPTTGQRDDNGKPYDCFVSSWRAEWE